MLVLRFYKDLTQRETAQYLRILTGTVASQTARAMTTLRLALGETNAIEETT